MNILDVLYLNDGELNWDAIRTIVYIIFSAFLLIIALGKYIQVKKQTRFMKIDELNKEMDELVKKLFDEDMIFIKENPYDAVGGPNKKIKYEIEEKERKKFWNEIEQNKYLTSDYLCSAIDNFIKNRRYGGGHDGDKAHDVAKTELFTARDKRYSELQDELEEKTWIIKKWYFRLKNKLSKYRKKS